jgi:hypothetical protein
MPWAVFVSTGNGLCAAITLAKILHAMTAGRTLKYAVLLMFWIVPASVAYAATSPSPSHCVFHRVDDHFGGSCGALFDQTPAMTLSPATGITTGVWRDDLHPASVWAGDMTDQGYPNAPLELEIYTGGWGVLRTVYGWFAVTQFAVSSTLSFDLDASLPRSESKRTGPKDRARGGGHSFDRSGVESRRQPQMSGQRDDMEHLLCVGESHVRCNWVEFIIDAPSRKSSARLSKNALRRATTITTSWTTTMILRHTLTMSRVSSRKH